MTIHERLAADYKGTSMTVGRHPLYHSREALNELGVTTARELRNVANGRLVRVAGCVIVRQRPGTAKGIVFISMEDETGIVNVVVMPDRFEADRVEIVTSPYLMIEGKVQNVDNVIHVLARRIERLESRMPVGRSHDFR
jgi:error-prone DNA polymerase